jgi:hypothetical protein
MTQRRSAVVVRLPENVRQATIHPLIEIRKSWNVGIVFCQSSRSHLSSLTSLQGASMGH